MKAAVGSGVDDCVLHGSQDFTRCCGTHCEIAHIVIPGAMTVSACSLEWNGVSRIHGLIFQVDEKSWSNAYLDKYILCIVRPWCIVESASRVQVVADKPGGNIASLVAALAYFD